MDAQERAWRIARWMNAQDQVAVNLGVNYPALTDGACKSCL
jgi:hypothetical protein